MAECSTKFLAKLFDLTERRIQQLAVEGRLVKAARGKYDLFDSIKGYTKYLKEQAKASEKGLIEENRRIKELKRLEYEGTLVNVDELRWQLMDFFTSVRTQFRAIPAKVTQEICHIARAEKDRSGDAKVFTLLLKEIDAVLLEISRWKGPTTTKKEVKNDKEKAAPNGHRKAHKKSNEQLGSNKN